MHLYIAIVAAISSLFMWTVHILTLFPEIYPGLLASSVIGRALSTIWGLEAFNIRDFATDKHRTVDDSPYGGGSGMVLRPDVLGRAIEQCFIKNAKPIYYLSPRGRMFNQGVAQELVSMTTGINIICGRYEGVDERIFQEYKISEISLGDFVVSSGDVALLPLIDCCVRMLPGVLKKEDALQNESFGSAESYLNLLEYPHYTKPCEWRTHKVPKTLLSGHHAEIARWRLEQAEEKTRALRPDLWSRYINNNK